MALNMKITVLWDVAPSFQRNLPPPSFTLKMAGAGSSKTVVYLCHTTQCHIPEGSDLRGEYWHYYAAF